MRAAARGRRSPGEARRAAAAAILACALFAGLACADADAPCRSALEGAPIEPGVGFGGLRVGMTAEELEAAIGPAEAGAPGAWEYPSCGFVVIFGQHDPGVSMFLAGHGLAGGRRMAERFTARTADGLGIGSTREDVVALLGEPPPNRDPELLGYPSQGIAWILRDGRVAHVTIGRPRPPEPPQTP